MRALVFDNDAARAWAAGLDEVDDLSLVEAALEAVEEAGEGPLDAAVASEALAACEVLARLAGPGGVQTTATAWVDTWVAGHPLRPPAALLRRARAVVERVAGRDTVLSGRWAVSPDAGAWKATLEDLALRLSA